MTKLSPEAQKIFEELRSEIQANPPKVLLNFCDVLTGRIIQVPADKIRRRIFK